MPKWEKFFKYYFIPAYSGLRNAKFFVKYK